MSAKFENLEAACEAILFYYGAPLSAARLAKILGVPPSECRVALEALGERLAASPDRGLTLLMNGDEATLATKPAFKDALEALAKEEFQETLTPAALETLSLVGYLGPVTRASVDYIRGVNSSFTLRNLLLRGLIERAPAPRGGARPNDGSVGRGYVYAASMEFLKHMGLRMAGDLPDYEKYRASYRAFEAAMNQSETMNQSEANAVEALPSAEADSHA